MGNDEVYRLSGSNWSTWSEFMKGTLDRKGLGHTIEDGAEVNDADSRKARGFIIQGLTPTTVKLP